MSDDPVAADFNPNRAYLASLVAAGLVAGNVRVLRTLARLLCCCCAVLAALAQPRNLDLESVPRKAKTHVCLITPVVCRSVDGNFGNLPIFPSTGQNRFRYIHTRLVSPKSAATTFRGGGHMHVTLSVEYATLNSV
jgi:hypothetical protein